jgi:hypothetical protein
MSKNDVQFGQHLGKGFRKGCKVCEWETSLDAAESAISPTLKRYHTQIAEEKKNVIGSIARRRDAVIKPCCAVHKSYANNFRIQYLFEKRKKLNELICEADIIRTAMITASTQYEYDEYRRLHRIYSSLVKQIEKLRLRPREKDSQVLKDYVEGGNK